MIIRNIDSGEMLEGNIPDLISQEDRVKNVFLYGRPEGGRNDLLASFLEYDQKNNRGFTLIDPLGEFSSFIKKIIPPDNLITFDPSDPKNPWQLDYFTNTAGSERAAYLAVNNFVSILESTFFNGKFSGLISKLVYIATLSASQTQEPNLQKIIDFLDQKTRVSLVSGLTDNKTKKLWEDISLFLNSQNEVEVMALINKLKLLVVESLGKRVFDNSKKKLDLMSIMQNNKYLLCDLDKAKIGEENSVFYGLLISQMLQDTAAARYSLPLDQSMVHQLYINRFENYANKDIFASFISESQPLGINLHLATESLYNLDRDMLGNLFGNFGNLVCFKAGRADAEILAKNIGLFLPSDFENLGHREMIVRLIADQKVTQPVKMRLGLWSKNQP